LNIYEQCLAVPDAHTNLIIGGWNEVMGNLDVDNGMTQKMFNIFYKFGIANWVM
jgi:hypothetical protein